MGFCVLALLGCLTFSVGEVFCHRKLIVTYANAAVTRSELGFIHFVSWNSTRLSANVVKSPISDVVAIWHVYADKSRLIMLRKILSSVQIKGVKKVH